MSGLYSDLPEEANAKSQDGGQFIESGGWSKPSTTKKSNTTMAFKPRQTSGSSSSSTATSMGTSSTVASSSSSASSVATTVSTTTNNNNQHHVSAASMAFKPRQTVPSRNTTSTTTALGYTETLVKKRSLDGPTVSSFSSSSSNHESSISYSLSDHMEVSMRNQQHTPELNMSFEVDDPYDPSRPNDYLSYCEERLDQQRQKELAEENLRKFAEIERHREQMEKERAEAIQSGDVQRIQKVAMGAGRGRGRGLSNLPAWMSTGETIGNSSSSSSSSVVMTTGQFEDNEGGGTHRQVQFSVPEQPSSRQVQFAMPESPSSSSSSSSSSSMQAPAVVPRKKQSLFTNPSSVVLLENMVGVGEVDDLLAEETKQECSKYGPVQSCVIYEESDVVRIFVRFETQESAVRAFRDMNGRYFAGRQISASFYDESKYERKELASTRPLPEQ